MPYCFELESDLTDNIQRIALQQLNKAAKYLSSHADQPFAVLEARKALKRLRALLKLIRPALDPKIYRSEANRLRGMARQLSMARDAEMLDNALLKLRADFRDEASRTSIEAFRALVPDLTVVSLSVSQSKIEDVRHALEETSRSYRRIELVTEDLEILFRGLEQGYAKARTAYRTAYALNTADAFHDWRKPMQVHWRHTRLLKNAWPAYFEPRIIAARELSHVLGEDHDLSTALTQAKRAAEQDLLNCQDHRQLAVIIAKKQNQLRQVAGPMGKLLFNEPAKAHARRALRTWQAAIDLTKIGRSSVLDHGAPPHTS